MFKLCIKTIFLVALRFFFLLHTFDCIRYRLTVVLDCSLEKVLQFFHEIKMNLFTSSNKTRSEIK